MQLLQQEGQLLVTIAAYIEQDQHLHGEQRVCCTDVNPGELVSASP